MVAREASRARRKILREVLVPVFFVRRGHCGHWYLELILVLDALGKIGKVLQFGSWAAHGLARCIVNRNLNACAVHQSRHAVVGARLHIRTAKTRGDLDERIVPVLIAITQRCQGEVAGRWQLVGFVGLRGLVRWLL